jgi:plastocyanin
MIIKNFFISCLTIVFLISCNDYLSEKTNTLSSSSTDVRIISMAFNPATNTIAAGKAVKWVNNDNVAHTATSYAGPASFDSGTIPANGGTYSHTFTLTGTYDYKCTFHPSMLGTIIVTN